MTRPLFLSYRWIYFSAKMLALLMLYFSLSYFCEKQTKGFSLIGILPHRPFNPSWQTRDPLPEELQQIDKALAQKYHYLGRGGQCYAFISEDGSYVIKFLRQKVYSVPLWHNWIPIPYLFDRYKNKKRWKREDKLMRDFSSYKFAFEEIQEMTGLLLVHLNQTQHLKTRLTLTDRLNIEHTLDLDRFDFVLQKKAEMISPTIINLIQSGQIDKAKQLIDLIAKLIIERCQKGLEDWDPEVRTNCGLIADRVIKIDVGRFIPNEEMKSVQMCKRELDRIIGPFQEWLRHESPLLADYCDEAITKALAQQSQ